jgi:carbonic anhydrase
MRLLEAIIEANHRAVAGDSQAGIHPAEFVQELPIVALTCIDPRLNPLMPGVLGVPEEHFVWLRNAGNIITGPLSSTMRSLAMACAIKNGKEIAIIGHTDCQAGKMTTMGLIDRLRALGVERSMLPDNISEFFGVFASERQNVIKGVDIARHSPLIGPKVPVHGLLVDTQTGGLEWLVNGYQALESIGDRWKDMVKPAIPTAQPISARSDFKIGDAASASAQIGEGATKAEDWMSQTPAQAQPQPRPATPPKIPLPPPIKPLLRVGKGDSFPRPQEGIAPPPIKPSLRFGKGGKWERR